MKKNLKEIFTERKFEKYKLIFFSPGIKLIFHFNNKYICFHTKEENLENNFQYWPDFYFTGTKFFK